MWVTACAQGTYHHRAEPGLRSDRVEILYAGATTLEDSAWHKVTGMRDAQLDRLKSFRAFVEEAEAGGTVPPVSKDDLKSLHDVCVQMRKRYSGKDGVITLDLMARTCNPGANLAAVWLRHSRLRLLIRQGLLADWQHGTELDDAVYRVAANFPMHGVDFDPVMFIQRLREEKADRPLSPEMTAGSGSPQK